MEGNLLIISFKTSREFLLAKYSKPDKKALENYIETLKNKSLTPLTKEQQQKLKDYEKVVKERDSLKYFGKVSKSTSDALIDQVNQHIIKAYNSSQHLQGYYLSLMKRFLDWEFTGNEEQKEICQKLKPNLNQCVSFLEKYQELGIRPFQPLKG